MKKIFFLFGLCILIHFANGQILKKVTDRVKNRVDNNANNKVNNTVDKTVDDAMNPNKNKDNNSGDPNAKADANKNNESSTGPATLKTYSKYDFVPGEKIIVFEDFAQDAVGDFPDKWNTNAAGEVMTIEGKQGHWFAIGKTGVYMPDFIDSLPDDFTLEFDMLVDKPVHSWGIDVNLTQLPDRNRPADWSYAKNNFSLNILPGSPDFNNNGTSSYRKKKNGVEESSNSTKLTQFIDISRPVHVAFWRQKERLRVYLNEEKTWDVPKAILPEAKLNSLVFNIPTSNDQWRYLITNLRLAVGVPDTRKKILEQNKWVTHGILFDVNSATIKPESYGTLKEMASVLKEYADLKVKIVGHTDADGADASNLDLSKRRAASVKSVLAKEFGIDESRMETDGKGEGEPIDKNDNPTGKANNRRVEFIKI
jgi:outer membrane protein OmpA-like peptidoglycan-associated protein